MKAKIITVIVVVILVIVTIIAAINVKSNKDTKFNITTSFYPVYIATINITDNVENVNVTNLTKDVTGCIHDYTLTTSELVSLSDADVLIINGAGMEGFMEKVISNYKNLEIINSSEGIELIEKENDEELEVHDHEHEENSHIFGSVTNYIKQVKNITEGIIKLDPKNKELYLNNCKKYIEKLESLKEDIKREINSLSYKNIVTYHDSFDYFAKEFGLDVVGTVEDEHGISPSAKEVVKLVEIIKEKNVKAIFIEPDSNTKLVNTIANETHTKVYTLNPGTIGNNSKDEYINIMRNNMNVLKEALK